MSIYKGSTLIAGGSQQTPLLSFVWADHLLSDISWLRADTFSWQAGSVYTAVYSHLTSDISGKTLQSETIGGTTIQFYLADDGHKICPASEESNVSAIYSATGVAWYYILDTVNTRFKLPRSENPHKNYIPNYSAKVDLGVNITYTASENGWVFWDAVNTTRGDFYVNEIHIGQALGSVNNWADCNSLMIPVKVGNTYRCTGRTNFWFAPNMKDTYYHDNNKKHLYFYVGQFTQTAISQTAGLNAELFNGKADINTVVLKGHQVIEFQAPTASNNYTWYRKYADGWVEQGGVISTNVDAQFVQTLPVTMSDSNYSVQVTRIATADYHSTINGAWCIAWNRTTTSFTTWGKYSSFTQSSWQVSGMAQ